MASTLAEFFEHNLWANEILLRACTDLTDVQIDTTIVGTFGSSREIIVHLVAAQGRIAFAATGEPVNDLRESDSWPGMDRLIASAMASGEALLQAAIEAETGAQVTTIDRGMEFVIPVWLLLLQANIHATEHRSQVAATFSHLGIEPPGMDGRTYHESEHGGDWSQLWSG